MTVGEIMDEDPLIVPLTASFESLLQTMARSRAPRLACVVDGQEKLIGVVTSFDLLRSCLGGSGLWGLFASEGDEREAVMRGCGRTAEDMMTKKAAFLREDDSCLKALDLIVTKRVGSVPVLDAWDRPVGEVNRGCLLRMFDTQRRNNVALALDEEIRELRKKRSEELGKSGAK